MKTLIRYVFAAFLATTVYYYSNGSENINVINNSENMYEFAEGHPLYEQPPKTLQEILDNNLCPSTGQRCASEVGNPDNVIQWNGGSTKF
jgi:hypothetical protein